MKPRIIALGNEDAGDDAAAIQAARALEGKFAVTIAGRPGAGLLELLEPRGHPGPTVLVDVTRSGQAPGRIVSLPLAAIASASIIEPQVSSHGFGPGEALRLAAALGRERAPGHFVGIEGLRFEAGQPLSAPVSAAMHDFIAAIRSAATQPNEP